MTLTGHDTFADTDTLQEKSKLIELLEDTTPEQLRLEILTLTVRRCQGREADLIQADTLLDLRPTDQFAKRHATTCFIPGRGTDFESTKASAGKLALALKHQIDEEQMD